MLDIVYPSHSESEVRMGSFTISSKQLTASRCCDLWERVGLECVLVWRVQKRILGPFHRAVREATGSWECWQDHSYPQLRGGSWSPLSLAILLPSTKLEQVPHTTLWSRHGSQLCHSLCDLGHITSVVLKSPICKIRWAGRIANF